MSALLGMNTIEMGDLELRNHEDREGLEQDINENFYLVAAAASSGSNTTMSGTLYPLSASYYALSASLSPVLPAYDAFVGAVTGSSETIFRLQSDSYSNATRDIGADKPGYARVITGVSCFAELSGSGGVTTVDVLMQDAGGVFNSIFSGSNTQRPAVSASIGNYVVVSKTSFLTSSWPAGQILRANLLNAAGDATTGAQKGLSCIVYWRPSGSFLA